MPRIPLHIRAEIVKKIEQGTSQAQVARVLGVSRRAVQEIMRKSRAGVGLHDLKKKGRKRKLTIREERKIERESRKHPKWTANELLHSLNLGAKVSVNTVKRSLRRSKLFGRIAVSKPLLTSKQIKKRLQWCVEKNNWSQNKWDRIVFTDECCLQLHPRQREYVRRRSNERFKPEMLRKTVKFPRSIMIWGAIRSDGVRQLVRCERNVDSLEYQRILDVALPHVMTGRHVLQYDGAPCHTSASSRRYLESKAIRHLSDWPAQSPDLNLIENLWNELKRTVREMNPTNLEDLWKAADAGWAAISSEKIRRLYDSMSRRICAVIAAKGGNTKY